MKNNKGFSLVELIIVIAIMAILVGVMAPQLIKYVEKAKISSDLDLLSSLEAAMVYGITEAEIYEDPPSKADIDQMINDKLALEDLDPNGLLYQEVVDTLGVGILTDRSYVNFIKSKHGSNATIYLTYQHDIKNPVKIWINTTDITGEGNSYTADYPTDSDFEKTIHVN